MDKTKTPFELIKIIIDIKSNKTEIMLGNYMATNIPTGYKVIRIDPITKQPEEDALHRRVPFGTFETPSYDISPWFIRGSIWSLSNEIVKNQNILVAILKERSAITYAKIEASIALTKGEVANLKFY